MFQKFDLEKGEFAFECIEDKTDHRFTVHVQRGMSMVEMANASGIDKGENYSDNLLHLIVRVFTPVGSLYVASFRETEGRVSELSFVIEDQTPKEFADWLTRTFEVKFESKMRDTLSFLSFSKKFETKYYATFPWGEIVCKYEVRENEPMFYIIWN